VSLVGGSSAHAQATLTTLNGTQGGTIVYGVVDGATTRAAALGGVLRTVHNSCGEKPQVGSVFRVRGTNSDAVFFAVADHPHGNRPAAGMIIAAQTGPQTVEAAMVTDDAARFNSTVNPLLNQLFSVWHPGGNPGSMPDVPGSGGGVPPTPQATLSDETATLSLPAGWTLDPNCSRGFALVSGPHGEDVGLDLFFAALDPQGQTYKNLMRWGAPASRYVILPGDVDLNKSFLEVWQKLRAVNKMAPAPMKIASIRPLSAPPLAQCVETTGQIDPDGKGMKELRALLCKMAPDQNGAYGFVLSLYRLPLGATDQQRATASAIIASYKVNVHLVLELVQAEEDAIQAQQQDLKPMGQQAIKAMHRAGGNAAEAARAAQWSRFNQLENDIFQPSRFSNYLLDQSVVENNNVSGPGGAGYATLWTSIADALVRSNPNRYEAVNTPVYWNGVDF
jgi:hypothetical protein